MTTVWITGGKGFIGRHLARSLAAQDRKVLGIGHGLWPAEEAERWGFAHWCNGEIEAANLSQLQRMSGAPDLVFHLAGGSSVGASFQNPHEDFCRTVESSARLFEWLRLSAPQTGVVCVSSAAVYGAGHGGKIPESAQLSPYSPYGAHKAMMESLVRSYAENFGLKAVIVRLFSVYGAGLEKQLLWDLCSKLDRHAGDSQVTLGGSGEELRDWLHVEDAARLLALASTRCEVGCPIINGGTGTPTPIRAIASLVCSAWGGSTTPWFSGIARQGDPASLVADNTLASQLGFSPATTLEAGICQTVQWFKTRH